MFCPNCGKEIPEGKTVCEACGNELSAATQAPEESAAEAAFDEAPADTASDAAEAALSDDSFIGKISKIIKSPLYLVCTILFSLYVVLDIAAGSGIDLFTALICVGLWVAYANAASGKLTETGFKIISGTVRAQKIVMWVVFGIFAALALVFIILGFVLPAAGIEVSDILNSRYFDMTLTYQQKDILPYIEALVGALSVAFVFIMLGIIFVLIAVITLLVNLLFIRRAHMFAKSVKESVISGENRIYAPLSNKVWLIIYAVISFFSLFSIGGVISVFRTIACIAALICAFIIYSDFQEK